MQFCAILFVPLQIARNNSGSAPMTIQDTNVGKPKWSYWNYRKF